MTRDPRNGKTRAVEVRAAVPEDAPELAAILADVGWFSEVTSDETELAASIAERVFDEAARLAVMRRSLA